MEKIKPVFIDTLNIKLLEEEEVCFSCNYDGAKWILDGKTFICSCCLMDHTPWGEKNREGLRDLIEATRETRDKWDDLELADAIMSSIIFISTLRNRLQSTKNK
jgi:hypothetical protein